MDATEILIEAFADGSLDVYILEDSLRGGRWGILAIRDALLPDAVADSMEHGGIVRQLLFRALQTVDWPAIESWIDSDRASALSDEFGPERG